MKIKQIATAAALCVGAALSLPAAAATITNTDGAIPDWSGFDWSQNGTAFTSGFTGVVGSSFDLTVFAVAVALVDTGGNAIPLLRLDASANGSKQAAGWYEYTLVAKVSETITSCTATTCNFSITGGTFDIYYDTAANANALGGQLGLNFQDGISIVSGTFGAQSGGTFTTGGTGSNSTTVTGSVVTTNGAFINPALLATNATTTLQLNQAVTSWVNPGGFNNVAFNGAGFGEIIFQADANQTFTEQRVPEPGTLSLLALALLGGGAAARRRKAQQ